VRVIVVDGNDRSGDEMCEVLIWSNHRNKDAVRCESTKLTGPILILKRAKSESTKMPINNT
jgi:hypothetical protein